VVRKARLEIAFGALGPDFDRLGGFGVFGCVFAVVARGLIYSKGCQYQNRRTKKKTRPELENAITSSSSSSSSLSTLLLRLFRTTISIGW